MVPREFPEEKYFPGFLATEPVAVRKRRVPKCHARRNDPSIVEDEESAISDEAGQLSERTVLEIHGIGEVVRLPGKRKHLRAFGRMGGRLSDAVVGQMERVGRKGVSGIHGAFGGNSDDAV